MVTLTGDNHIERNFLNKRVKPKAHTLVGARLQGIRCAKGGIDMANAVADSWTAACLIAIASDVMNAEAAACEYRATAVVSLRVLEDAGKAAATAEDSKDRLKLYFSNHRIDVAVEELISSRLHIDRIETTLKNRAVLRAERCKEELGAFAAGVARGGVSGFKPDCSRLDEALTQHLETYTALDARINAAIAGTKPERAAVDTEKNEVENIEAPDVKKGDIYAV